MRKLKSSVLIATLTLLAEGCSWSIHRIYSGPERPLEEVAVLFGGTNIDITYIDGEPVGPALEIHLLPGSHEITAIYIQRIGKYTLWGSPVTSSTFFKKGHVYELKLLATQFETPEASVFKSRQLVIVDEGTIKDEAVRLAGNPSTRSRDGIPPHHWEELLDRCKDLLDTRFEKKLRNQQEPE